MTALAVAPVYGSPEWNAERFKYIGASETPMACGVSPYGGPLDLARIKLKLDTVEVTHAMKRGHIYEGAIADEFSVLHPDIALERADTLAHRAGDWLRATVDRIAVTRYGRGVWEAKLVHPSQRDAYGESGSDEVPDDKLVQVQTQMDVHQLPFAHLVVNFGFETREYFVESNRETQQMIVDTAHDLWHNFIAKGLLPEPTVNVDTYDAIQHTLTQKSDNLLLADAATALLVEEFGAIKARLKADEEREKELKTLLGLRIGNAYGIETPSAGKVIWPQSDGKESKDFDGLVRELNVPADVVQKFTRVGQPYRSMRFYPPKKGKK